MFRPAMAKKLDKKKLQTKKVLVYKLRKPDKKIAIDWIKPTKDFETATAMTTINLQVQTSGGGNYHYCSFSFSGYKNMIQMFETGKGKTHSQTLNRPVGTNTIYVKCHDETGDFAEDSTTFKIIRDTSMPQISRILQLNGKLLFYTLKNSECRYSTESCQFNWKGSGLAGNGQSTQSMQLVERHIISDVPTHWATHRRDVQLAQRCYDNIIYK